MNIKFNKWHGAGNDFIILGETAVPDLNPLLIKKLCNRKRGIGADGLIVLKISGNEDSLVMKFYNSDGSSAEMCGNGLRCAAMHAHRYLLKGKKNITFTTDAGQLSSEISGPSSVQIEIPITEEFREFTLTDGTTLYKGGTGVPHAIVFTDDIEKTDVRTLGSFIRQHSTFKPEGTNVNFLQPGIDSPHLIRTYERGVEDETSACGTGIAAAAICLHKFRGTGENLSFITPDKDILTVELILKDNIVSGVLLNGPAEEVFSGVLTETFTS